MAESGVASAIGMAIESTWRTVPKTGTSSAVVGIANTNPHRFSTILPGGGIGAAPAIDAPSDLDGTFEQRRISLIGKAYGGNINFQADGENLFYYLLGLFGKDVQTQLTGTGTFSTTVTPTYKHVFTPNAKGYAPSFTVEEVFGSKNYARLTSGVLVPALEFSLGGVIGCGASLVGYRQIPNKYDDTKYDFGVTPVVLPTQMGGNGSDTIIRTASPTYIDVDQGNEGNGPFVWAGMGYGAESGFSAAFMKINDVAVTPSILEGGNISIGRNVESHMVGGSGYDAGDCTGNQFGVSGRLPVLFKNNDIAIATLALSKISLNFRFTGLTIGTSAQKYYLEFYIPHAKFTRSSIEMNDGAMMNPGDFVAKYDSTLGASIKVTLVNTVTNASLAGTDGGTGAAGGLGGWSAS